MGLRAVSARMQQPKAGPKGPVSFSATANRPVGVGESGRADPDRDRAHEPAVSQHVELAPGKRGAERPSDGLNGDVTAELGPAVATVRQRFGGHLDPAAPDADDAEDERAAERAARPDLNETRPIGPGAEDDAAVQRTGRE